MVVQCRTLGGPLARRHPAERVSELVRLGGLVEGRRCVGEASRAQERVLPVGIVDEGAFCHGGDIAGAGDLSGVGLATVKTDEWLGYCQ